MKINFENVKHKYRKLIRKVYEKAEEYTGNKYDDAVITISFVKPEKIKDLNNQYRKVDKVTDVLSFPMLDINYNQHLGDFLNELAPDGGLYLGDVVICPIRAKLQAKEYNHSKKREIAFLALHGLLHIYGYDHIEEEDEKIMTSTSKAILNLLDIKRK